jgi:rhodanese-related sulfurtransferase
MDASISAATLKQSIHSSQPPLVIDVRRRERFFEAEDVIRGSLRRDPERVQQWKRTLPRSASVVVYCVHGHEVSQGVAKALQAKYLEGGIVALREMGGELFNTHNG